MKRPDNSLLMNSNDTSVIFSSKLLNEVFKLSFNELQVRELMVTRGDLSRQFFQVQKFEAIEDFVTIF